jgi:DNA invertase Pin-like site-specific DNA recombinase
MSKYGYVRVSTQDQHLDRQIIAMHEQGIKDKNIFMDKMSGKNFDRPRYKILVRRLRSGDVLYVKSIDRLGRNYQEILEQWRFITKECGADIAVIDMPLLNTMTHKDLLGTLIADIVLQLLSYVAHNEREMIRQRQAEGIAAARTRGVQFGRPTTEPPDNFAEIVRKWERREIELADALRLSGLKEATFYRRLRELRLVKRSKK